MKKNFTFIIFFTHIVSLLGQTSLHTKDSETQKNISYVNIGIVGDNFGYTSDENGKFTIKKNDIDKNLIFSAVGYKQKIVNLKDFQQDNIYLEPEAYQLSEVVIESQQNSKTDIKTTKGKTTFVYNNLRRDEPSLTLVAKFFPKNSEVPFLKTIKLKTKSYSNESKFNIRFYNVGENGAPNNLIYDKNVFCVAKKDSYTNKIDVSSYNIEIPENGIFIVFEYLLIDQNKFELEYDNKQVSTILYNPQIPMIKDSKNLDTWLNRDGTWIKHKIFSLGLEIVLTN